MVCLRLQAICPFRLRSVEFISPQNSLTAATQGERLFMVGFCRRGDPGILLPERARTSPDSTRGRTKSEKSGSVFPSVGRTRDDEPDAEGSDGSDHDAQHHSLGRDPQEGGIAHEKAGEACGE